jgi:predicted Zn-dependent protease
MSALLATLTVTTGGLGALLGTVGTMAAVTGYSRELETEADMEGLRVILKAGYNPQEAPKLFSHLKKEVEEEKDKEPFFFGTHPKLKERIENFESFIKTQCQGQTGGIENREIFLEKIHKVILDNSRLDLKAGRFTGAQQGVEKYLRIRPDVAEAFCLLGDIHRQRGEKGDIEKSKENYQKAIALSPSYADSYKGIGLIHYKEGEKLLSKKALEMYLSHSPQALDRAYIEECIRRCQEGEKE